MLSQTFGDVSEEVYNDADTVTSIDFHSSGNYFATGDKGGRIVVFQSSCVSNEDSKKSSKSRLIWQPFFQFQSHEKELDYLKSLQVNENINQLKFYKSSHNRILLSANDRNIKLWKISDRDFYMPGNFKSSQIESSSDIKFPKKMQGVKNDLGIEDSTIAIPKRKWENASIYRINSLSLNSDRETFLSCDDLYINLWNIEQHDRGFNIVSAKPQDIGQLAEVITCAQFHPSHSYLLGFGTSKGTLNICDMRESAIIHPMSSKVYAEEYSSKIIKSPPISPRVVSHRNSISSVVHKVPQLQNRSIRLFEADDDLFSYKQNLMNSKLFQGDYSIINELIDVLPSISDLKFSSDGKYVVTRDYLHVRMWDLAMGSRPLITIPVHDYLKTILPTIYNETESIFDKFEVFLSSKDNTIITGSYGNKFSMYKPNGEKEGTYRLPIRDSPSSICHSNSGDLDKNREDSVIQGFKSLKVSSSNESTLSKARLHQKVLSGCWHPDSNSYAVAGQTGLFVYRYES